MINSLMEKDFERVTACIVSPGVQACEDQLPFYYSSTWKFSLPFILCLRILSRDSTQEFQVPVVKMHAFGTLVMSAFASASLEAGQWNYISNNVTSGFCV